MVGQVELKVVAPQFASMDALDAATDRAADVIYKDYPQGGPSIAGNTRERAMTCLLFIDEDTPDAWLPQLRVLVDAVAGPIERVEVGPLAD